MADVSHDAVAWRRYEQNRPRTETTIDKSVYADYAGSYRLIDGTYYFVVSRDGHLFTRVMGQQDIEIFPESETQFFMKGLPVQVSFVRDPDGAVNSLVHHQNGAETKAERTDPAAAARAGADLDRRKREKIPDPRSEAVLRRVIAQALRGEPDYDLMSPALAAAAREQRDLVKAQMARAGELVSVRFRGVGQSGFDVYEAKFANVEMEWDIVIGVDGKISGLFFRALP